ncbi:barstar family protein [Streptomyces sp. NPDC097619]|uniref:barstar family protein n=1 Tax=Streptomyces sp. NPDC097619 TaxID=3157228 RepID=UPI0033217252
MTLVPEPLAPAAEAARESGRAVVELGLDGVRTKAALMDRCARELALPDWFGGNWDALADVLADTVWYPEPGARVLLAVTGWREYARLRPTEWETFREVLEAAAESAAEQESEQESERKAGREQELGREPESVVREAAERGVVDAGPRLLVVLAREPDRTGRRGRR